MSGEKERCGREYVEPSDLTFCKTYTQVDFALFHCFLESVEYELTEARVGFSFGSRVIARRSWKLVALRANNPNAEIKEQLRRQ